MKMKSRFSYAIFIIILLVPYVAAWILGLLGEEKKNQIRQNQLKLNQAIMAFHDRIDFERDRMEDSQILCDQADQNSDENIRILIDSFKEYPGALKEIRHQSNGLDMMLSMPTQDFFHWILGDVFRKTCLTPNTIEMKNSLGLLTIKLHFFQVSYV
jgi:hypothetical protein